MFEVKNISMIYDMNTDEKLYALNGFDLKLPDKGLVGIIGPSGSGKSTLMYCLSSLKKPTEGEVIYNGKDISSISNKEREMLRRNDYSAVFHAFGKHRFLVYGLNSGIDYQTALRIFHSPKHCFFRQLFTASAQDHRHHPRGNITHGSNTPKNIECFFYDACCI